MFRKVPYNKKSTLYSMAVVRCNKIAINFYWQIFIYLFFVVFSFLLYPKHQQLGHNCTIIENPKKYKNRLLFNHFYFKKEGIAPVFKIRNKKKRKNTQWNGLHFLNGACCLSLLFCILAP